jgi:hypothetical protein
MNKITEKYTSTIDTTFILGNPLGEENPAKLPYHKSLYKCSRDNSTNTENPPPRDAPPFFFFHQLEISPCLIRT